MAILHFRHLNLEQEAATILPGLHSLSEVTRVTPSFHWYRFQRQLQSLAFKTPLGLASYNPSDAITYYTPDAGLLSTFQTLLILPCRPAWLTALPRCCFSYFTLTPQHNVKPSLRAISASEIFRMFLKIRKNPSWSQAVI